MEILTDDANLHAVSRYFATYNLVNAPVVDHDDRAFADRLRGSRT